MDSDKKAEIEKLASSWLGGALAGAVLVAVLGPWAAVIPAAAVAMKVMHSQGGPGQ